MIPLGVLAGSRHVPSGGGGTFSPTEVAGLDLWLSAANLDGLSSGDHQIALERLVIERAVSVNTAAAGGNASLMTIG